MPQTTLPEPATVEVSTDSELWDGVDLETLAADAVAATLAHLGLEPSEFEVSLLATDDAQIAELNGDFRGKRQPTNVLSWPSEERGAATPGDAPTPPDPDSPFGAELGDLALAFETCAREAAEAEKPLTDHLTHLIVHGTLHLLGYDHETDADAALMEGLEIDILAALNVANPYETAML